MTARWLVVVLASTSAARADTPRDQPTAIEVDREAAPPGRVELGFDGGAPVDAWGVSAAIGWLDRPVAFISPDGSTTHPVRRRWTGAIGGALAVGRSVVVDARLAAARQWGDRLEAQGDRRALDRSVPLDLRLGARIRVSEGLFVRGDVTLPTGDERDFAGDASWSLGWQLIGRVTLPGDIVLAGAAGIRLRGTEVIVGDRLVGDELFGAAGLVVPLPPVRPLWCGADQVRMTVEVAGVLGDDIGMGQQGPSPLEARAGLVVRPRPDLANVTVGVRGARALVDEIGAPAARLVLELSYAP